MTATTSPIPLVEGGYSTIVADPPWRFGDTLPGPGRGAAKHYETMSLREILDMGKEVSEAAAQDAHLYLWCPSGFLEEAHAVVREWGFRTDNKQVLTWVKTKKSHVSLERLLAMPDEKLREALPQVLEDLEPLARVRMGMGHRYRNSTEPCLFAVRGKLPVLRRNAHNVFFAPRQAHSQKPQEFYDLVTSMSPGPRLELFSRTVRDGFQGWGYEYPEDLSGYTAQWLTGATEELSRAIEPA